MELTFRFYEEEAAKTAIYPNRGNNLFYPVLGLCGETGEIAEKAKKVLRDDGGQMTAERREALLGEIGDVLWYLAAFCFELGVTLEQVALTNHAKLSDRQARGVLHGSGDDR